MTGGESCGQEGERETHCMHKSDTMPHVQYVCCECVWLVCSGYECSVQWQVWDREVWQRVLGWLSGNDLAVTKEHTQL